MAKLRRRGNSIQIEAYSGIDPATGKRAKPVLRSVPAKLEGTREFARIVREVQAEADALAKVRAERRRDPANRARVHAAPQGVKPEDVTFRIAGEAWYRAHSKDLDRSGRQTPRVHLDAYLYPRVGDVFLWQFRSTIDRDVVHDPDLVSWAEFWEELATSGKVKAPGGLARETLQRTRGVARQVFNYAISKGWGNVTANPVTDAKLPKAPPRKSTTPKTDDAATFFARLEDEAPTLYAFGLVVSNGPRPTEVYPLRWDAVDLDAAVAWVGEEGAVRVWEPDETGKVVERFVIESGDTHKRRHRRIRLDPVTVDALRVLRKRAVENALAAETTLPDDAFVFTPTVDGSAMYGGSWATRAFRRAVERARSDGYRLPEGIRLYDVRHLAITAALAAGHPVADVAQRFGNSPRTIYARYAHAIPGNDEKLAATMGDIWQSAEADRTVTPIRATEGSN